MPAGIHKNLDTPLEFKILYNYVADILEDVKSKIGLEGDRD
jgi:hypothetical protein